LSRFFTGRIRKPLMSEDRKPRRSRQTTTGGSRRKTARGTASRKAHRPRSASAVKSGKTSANRTSANKSSAKKPSAKRWSQRVTRESDALDLKRGVFTLRDPGRIAASLKRSAERSSRRKASAYRSALSMLTFYINRAGKTLPKTQRARLQRAKAELKRQFGRDG
jgi:hypothetical protein